MCSSDIFLGLLALLFPPLAVWVKRGICSADSVINILLCVLGYLPGLIHAWYIIIKFPEPDFDYEVLPQHVEAGGSGHVAYVVVTQPRSHITEAVPKVQSNGNGSSGNLNYGTAAAAAAAAAAPAQAAASSSSAPASSSAAGSSSAAANTNAGEGSSNGPPPSYAQAVAGDNKIQNQD